MHRSNLKKVTFSGAINAIFPYWRLNAGYAGKKVKVSTYPSPVMFVSLHHMKKI